MGNEDLKSKIRQEDISRKLDGMGDSRVKERDLGVTHNSEKSPAEDVEVVTAWKVPDGGWGWVVVVSASVISLIVDGLSYTFGLFLGEFQRAFQEPKSKIALANSLQVGIYLFIGPVVSALTNRFGCRPIIVVGSFMAAVGFMVSSFSSDVTMLIFSYGVIGGLGFGLMYLPTIVAVSVYFEKKRAVATGIAVCGSGVGTFILAPFTEFLLSEYNWRWTLLLLSGVVLNGMVFGALVRPLKLQKVQETVTKSFDEGVSKPLVKEDVNLKNTDTTRGEKLAVQTLKLTVPDQNGFSQSQSDKYEQIPLMAPTQDRHIELEISSSYTGEHGTPQQNRFSSTPEIQVGTSTSNKSWLSMTQARRRTQSTSEHTDVTRPFSPRAHIPVGLSLISLPDATLNQIREDLHLPLSRRDIRLSDPLPLGESQSPGQKLYIQSIQSMRNLASLSSLGSEQTSHGLWSCLPTSLRESMEEMLDLSILKEKSYWCVLLGNFFCMLGFYTPFVYVPDMAVGLGMSQERAAFLISIIGITNTVGRVMTGVLTNYFQLNCATVTSVALLVAGLTTILFPLSHSYAALATASAIFGVCVAAYISLCSVLLCELLGVESLTNAFGFVILFRGMACIMGPPIAGAIIDATGVFDPSFYMGGGMIILGALAHALLLIPCTRRRKVS